MEEDVRGDRLLYESLQDIEVRLLSVGRPDAARRVHEASEFYGGGSPSEFLGESRLVLTDVVAESEGMPVDLLAAIMDVIAKINIAFRAVGDR